MSRRLAAASSILSLILIALPAQSQTTNNGTQVCAQAGTQTAIRAIPDGTGGTIITWQDSRKNGYDIYAQRLNSVGVPQWAPNGIPVCQAPSTQQDPVLVSDGAGGALIAWTDYRTGSADIYMQRLGSNGAAQW